MFPVCLKYILCRISHDSAPLSYLSSNCVVYMLCSFSFSVSVLHTFSRRRFSNLRFCRSPAKSLPVSFMRHYLRCNAPTYEWSQSLLDLCTPQYACIRGPLFPTENAPVKRERQKRMYKVVTTSTPAFTVALGK